MKRLQVFWLVFVLGVSAAWADEPISFEGKTITLIVTSSAGGGTDLSARLIANFISSHLPGKPSVVVRNIPGAQGVVGMNYLVNKVVPDGFALTVAGATLANPLIYRVAGRAVRSNDISRHRRLRSWRIRHPHQKGCGSAAL